MWRSWNVPRIALLVAMGAATVLSGGTLVAQTDYQPSPENLQARREFQDAKFGMFIHWACIAFWARANGYFTSAGFPSVQRLPFQQRVLAR
jgi:hypothetical protein